MSDHPAPVAPADATVGTADARYAAATARSEPLKPIVAWLPWAVAAMAVWLAAHVAIAVGYAIVGASAFNNLMLFRANIGGTFYELASVLLLIGLALPALLFHLIWVFHFKKHCQHYAQSLFFDSHSAVVWHLLPYVNLVLPYLLMDEGYRASHPRATPTNWKRVPRSLLVLWWWLLFVVGAVAIPWLASGLLSTVTDFSREVCSAVGIGLGSPLVAISLVLYVRMIDMLTRMQHHKLARFDREEELPLLPLVPKRTKADHNPQFQERH